MFQESKAAQHCPLLISATSSSHFAVSAPGPNMCLFPRRPEDEPSSTNAQGALHSPSLTRVSCRCRRVELELSDPAPLAIILDGCRDCSYFNAWLEGSATCQRTLRSPATERPSGPLTNLYFSNHIRFSFGEGNLRAYKLTSSSPAIRIATTCCRSMVLANHPLYAPELLMAPASACMSTTPGAARAACPVFTYSLSPAQRRALPAFVQPAFEVRGTEPADVQARMFDQVFDDMRARAALEPPADDAQGDWGTVQGLLERLSRRDDGFVCLDETPGGAHAVL